MINSNMIFNIAGDLEFPQRHRDAKILTHFSRDAQRDSFHETMEVAMEIIRLHENNLLAYESTFEYITVQYWRWRGLEMVAVKKKLETQKNAYKNKKEVSLIWD